MDFFTRQAEARKQTKKLVFYFVLAILAIVLAINLVFYSAYTYAFSTAYVDDIEGIQLGLDWFSKPYWIYITAGTLAIITLTSLFRSWQINSNPEAIISMVNATPVAANPQSRQEKQLVNIVEEMALASGLPIPKTYIMKEEQGLNAFVSGLTSSSAILVVTQGLLDRLNRSQLQGVIGHEYSHILNGDMRLNLRLMGIIAGILVIGQIGQTLLRGSHRSSGRRSESAGGVVAVAIGIFVVGYIGLFFGRIIKSAISRQREYLADASAVQFTRDREGIAGALLAIKESVNGSQLESDKAEEMSHMCFGASTKISQFFSGLLASHPPLDDRIQAVYPGFLRRHKAKTSADTPANKNRKQSTRASNQQASFADDLTSGISQFAESFGLEVNIKETMSALSTKSSTGRNRHSKISQAFADNIGKVSPDHLTKAEALLQTFEPKILQKARGEQNKSDSALSLIILFALANRFSREDFTNCIERQALSFKSISKQELLNSFNDFEALTFIQRHALFNIVLSKLSLLSNGDKKTLLQDLKKLLPSTSHLSVMGLASYASIMHRFEKRKPYESDINSYKKVAVELNILFKQLLTENDYSKTNWQNSEQHLAQLLKGFGIPVTPEKLNFDPQSYHKILSQLGRLKPMLKQQLILTIADAIQVDNKIDRMEYAYLRLVCEYLDCPIPLN